jgi:hypothetical protein
MISKIVSLAIIYSGGSKFYLQSYALIPWLAATTRIDPRRAQALNLQLCITIQKTLHNSREPLLMPPESFVQSFSVI